MLNTEKELSKYIPAYEPVSLKEPTEGEKRNDLSLKAYMDVEMKLESLEEGERRKSILAEVKGIFLKWVQYIGIEILHMPIDEAEDSGGELFISGSHRLGVRDIGADIDTVCVAPNFCTRDHFFTYLKNDLLRRAEVTDLIAIEDAFVPIISFDYRGVSIDLLFARLAENTVPKDIDILDDRILIGLDEGTEKSLNGPRVTSMIYKLVGEKTFPNFLIVLRCIRKWAKRRGIYGNKLGYLGGINCNIMVAFICQLYPNSSPSTLLFRFFKLYHEWKWPEPVMLNNIQPHPPGTLVTDDRVIWSAKNNVREFMPLITPAYPAMNSSFNVSSHSFEVMKAEIKRAHELRNVIVGEKKWELLFEPSDFFLKYNHYLACHIIGTGDNPESRGWAGFVESRIRRFLQYPFLETLPIIHPIQLYPIVSKTTRSAYSSCYFIGFHLDVDAIEQMDDKNIHIDDCAYRFQDSLLDPDRGYRGSRIDGLDFFVEHMTWKQLPKELFESLGGYMIAKVLRKERGYGKVMSTKKKNLKDINTIDHNINVVVGGGSSSSSSGGDVKNDIVALTSPNFVTSKAAIGGGGGSGGTVGGDNNTILNSSNITSSIGKDSNKKTVSINMNMNTTSKAYSDNIDNSGRGSSNSNSSSSSNTGSSVKRISYDIAKRSFPSDMYEGIGSTEVDTIESVRKKLNLDAFVTTSTKDNNNGDEINDLSRVNGKINNRYANKAFLASKLLYQHHQLTIVDKDKSSLSSSSSSSSTTMKKKKQTFAVIPHVTWQLLDNK